MGEILWGFLFVTKEVQECQENQNDHVPSPAVRRRYGRAWKRIRDSYVAQHPFCEQCYDKGILVETKEEHHKKPLSQGGTHDRSNLIALCKECHARIHAQSGDRWHNH